jgi:hypothetical protein
VCFQFSAIFNRGRFGIETTVCDCHGAVMGFLGVPAVSHAAEVGTQACTFYGSWLTDTDCTANRSTVLSIDNAELRVGYYNGQQFGWGRLTTSSPGYTLYFYVSFDGGKTIHDHDYISSGSSLITTWAHPTSSDPNRRFQICIYKGVTLSQCSPWW